MQHEKRGFFERLTGSARVKDEEEEVEEQKKSSKKGAKASDNEWMEEENDEAELAVDVYQVKNEIVVQTMIAGVKTEDIELTIARDMITIRGKREEIRNIDEDNYFTQELYWGKFARTILLPAEIEPEETEAIERHGLLTIKLQKIDKEKKANIKIKSI